MKKTLAAKAGFGRRHYETVKIALGVIVAVSSDAHTKTRVDKALKALTKLNAMANKTKG